MALADDVVKSVGGSAAGVAGAVGAVLLAPIVLPLVGRLIRPVLTTALQTGIVLYRHAHHAVSELSEEARSEIADARRSKASST